MDHLHRWEIIGRNSQSLRERCEVCGKIEVFYIGDNKTYLKAHERDFLQRGDPRFKREYGNN